MNTTSLRKRMSAAVVGTTAAALAVGALVQPAVSHAERVWDIQAWDTCMKGVREREEKGQISVQQALEEKRFCCDMSGGVWSADANGSFCAAPPATAQSAPQAPWDAGRAPRPQSAGGGQTPAPNAPPPASGGPGTVTAIPNPSGWGWGFGFTP
ncbi:hypothetical protein [Mycobacterium sp. SMC-4]|uniref:hypothetical protein n=1 Tax=Mycobacterium sp. SMC-4 TaxID=2857059 RepID=UPI0021B4C42F|nr:hypothetical protein [Mycobacterium sp. SMC-4]UXA17514.1 hypothetical protein KXD98_22780 [Mycobacterium sp. SMC-4]